MPYFQLRYYFGKEKVNKRPILKCRMRMDTILHIHEKSLSIHSIWSMISIRILCNSFSFHTQNFNYLNWSGQKIRSIALLKARCSTWQISHVSLFILLKCSKRIHAQSIMDWNEMEKIFSSISTPFIWRCNCITYFCTKHSITFSCSEWFTFVQYQTLPFGESFLIWIS